MTKMTLQSFVNKWAEKVVGEFRTENKSRLLWDESFVNNFNQLEELENEMKSVDLSGLPAHCAHMDWDDVVGYVEDEISFKVQDILGLKY